MKNLMKKLLIFSALLVFSAAAYCEQYVYKAKTIKEIDIVISAGTLNIASAKTKDIVIDITPDKPENIQRRINADSDGDLKIYLDDISVSAETVVNITVPVSANDIEINSSGAYVCVSDVKGSLSIDAAEGKAEVKNFLGDFDIDAVNAEVVAEGMFKKLDIESSGANIFVTMRKIPSLYDYSVEGDGNVILHLPSQFVKARLKLERKEFYGSLNIQ
ncbi:MAG: hypothetical protein LBL00_01140 [Endomicrobium sp.]|jgi:hypothetical protein|nr:hypothetical protein [Endomicrobium sp.]